MGRIKRTGKRTKLQSNQRRRFRFGWGLHNWLCESDPLDLSFLLFLFFSRLGHNQCPFLGLFKLPGMFLPFPVGSSIVPKVEVEIKIRRGNTAQPVNEKPNFL